MAPSCTTQESETSDHTATGSPTSVRWIALRLHPAQLSEHDPPGRVEYDFRIGPHVAAL